jgi:uncharacterized glyoxalase superfamily protein PhnB
MAKRPRRYRSTAVSHIYVEDASNASAFYKRAFGAVELFRVAHPNGKIMHATALDTSSPCCTSAVANLSATTPGR